ncbi:MAG TPA: hypothetical protein VH141_16510 [Pseudonocardia sp.]|nr:hypothetical protein [Pseudonocardia sp.]
MVGSARQDVQHAAGGFHVGQLMFREAMSEVYEAAVRDVVGFARAARP